MANLRIPRLVPKTNKSDVTTWFWQPSATLKAAGWKSRPLGNDEWAAVEAARDLNAQVEAWKMGGPSPRAIERRKARGTVDALITRYRREYLHALDPATGKPMLSDKTRENYETPLKRISMWAGDQQLAYVTPGRVRILKETLVGPEAKGGIGHASAHNTLKMLRQLFAFAISVDLVPKGQNPATDFGLGAPPPRRTIWKHAHEKAFDDAAYRRGLPSLTLARELALYSAQREGDLLRFNENEFVAIELFDPLLVRHFGDDAGVVKGWVNDQHKTGLMQLEVPFDRPLRNKVEDALRRHRARDRAAVPPRLVTYVIVDDRTGLPWKKRDFIKAWNATLADAAEATGMQEMRDLVWHDLRRTRVVRLRRMGMSEAQIATVTGTSPQTIMAMLKAYGPIDATMTAHALAAASAHETARDKAIEDQKEGKV
jgi:hypothetical protein